MSAKAQHIAFEVCLSTKKNVYLHLNNGIEEGTIPRILSLMELKHLNTGDTDRIFHSHFRGNQKLNVTR